MKKFFFSLFLNMLILVAVSNLFSGFVLPSDMMYWLSVVLGTSVLMMLYRPLLKFLTVKVNFVTYLLIVSLLVAGSLYALQLFVPEFYINASSFKAVDLNFITINAFELQQIGTLVGVALVSSIIGATMETLKKTGDD